MNSLSPTFLDALKFSGRSVTTLKALGEYRGRQTLFKNQIPEVLKRLKENAVIESAISSNRIEGVEVSPRRAKDLLERERPPRDRPEQEVAGYRDALAHIHSGSAQAQNLSQVFSEEMPFTPHVVLQLHEMLYRYQAGQGGSWKWEDNVIQERQSDDSVTIRFEPVSAKKTPAAMEELSNAYREALREKIEPLILLPLVTLDFLCIHPFEDGNGRVSRLLDLMLLYHHGYEVGRYIALERVIENSKETYYEALVASSEGWHEKKHDVEPWLNYWWGVLIAAHKEFEMRIEGPADKEMNKEKRIRLAVTTFERPFTISELDKMLPDISRDWIRKILRSLRDTGELRSEGVGRGARWHRGKQGGGMIGGRRC
ncbi:MAG: cell filamentation protein Fic [Flavobacteriaceae bacterium]|nr:MAG: cell filamentation protein Fic [Flavobacteriaceae bacterium]